jgi:hypothetical protein
MKSFKKSLIKYSSLAATSIMLGLGVYNALFMNSTSFMDQKHIVFIKRIDEINGRLIAAQKPLKWEELSQPVQKIAKPVIAKKVAVVKKSVAKIAKSQNAAQPQNQVVEAVIKNDLDLSLNEFFNSAKMEKHSAGDYSGHLVASNGMIESLEVSTPDGEVYISQAEMKGNTFEYEADGQKHSGMIYEVAQGSYMVTLTDGPLAGTRMKFAGNVDGSEVAEAPAPTAAPATDVQLNAENTKPEQVEQFGFNFNS